jgi:hydrogenase nickel incorporation protein HypA/HybF
VEERFEMHELQVTERILDIVIRHAAGHDVSRIVLIRLKIGELSDLEDEWIQRYFDYLSRGTLAENAKLAIQRAPIVLECEACSRSFEVRKDGLGGAECPECGGSDCRLVSGREYLIENIEVV